MDAVIAGLPFAAGFDWLESLLPVLFVLFWIGSQIVNAVQQARRGRQPPAVRPARPVQPVPDPAREVEVRGELDRQIEEFLRRSRTPAARPAPRRPTPVDQPRATRTPRTTTGQSPPPLPAAPPAQSAGRSPPAGADVARHVHAAFAHELEHLTSSLEAGAEPRRSTAAAPAADLVAALRNPASLRQLILLREVLDRPVDRW
jgi:hypothetical protein